MYFTAGYPNPESITSIIELLCKHGADIIEVGLPFSDPLADGPTIQQSSVVALRQGVTIEQILKAVSIAKVTSPIVLMGYLNPILQYGFEAFVRDAAGAGVAALIIPDLPPEVFALKYKSLYENHGLHPVFLVSPRSSNERIRQLDNLSRGFLYAISKPSTTGKEMSFGAEEAAWFERLKTLNLRNPVLAGFGVAQNSTLRFVFSHLPGAIVGSALIKSLDNTQSDYGIESFMNKLLNPQA